MFYKKSQSQETKNIDSYLVVIDNKRNRKAIFYHYTLLAEQPFEILFLNKGKGTIESVSEMKENIPRLFQTKKIELRNDALKKLISNPNHDEIQRTILDSDNLPDTITGELVEKIDRYLKANEQPPENIASLENGHKYTGSYETNSGEDSVDRVKTEKIKD